MIEIESEETAPPQIQVRRTFAAVQTESKTHGESSSQTASVETRDVNTQATDQYADRQPNLRPYLLKRKKENRGFQ